MDQVVAETAAAAVGRKIEQARTGLAAAMARIDLLPPREDVRDEDRVGLDLFRAMRVALETDDDARRRILTDVATRRNADREQAEPAGKVEPEDVVERRRNMRLGDVDDRRAVRLISEATTSNTDAIQGVEEWLGNPEPTMLLRGGTGRGKSYAGYSAIAWRGGKLVCAPMLAVIHAERDWLDAMVRRPGVLVVDDLGTEHLGESAYAVSQLDALVVGRHNAERKTLLVTNATTESFRSRYGERVWSRCRVVEVTGPDMRQAR